MTTEAVAMTDAMRLFLTVTALAVVPLVLLYASSFLRLSVVFALLRSAFGTTGAPPAAVLTGLALVLTFAVMRPTWTEVRERALDPLLAGRITFAEAVEAATPPLRTFLLRHTRRADLEEMLELQGVGPRRLDELSIGEILPAFVISELTAAFTIGVLVFIPFVLIDIVVASVLLSLGMMMVPPTVISLPLKLALFVAVDGWSLLVGRLVRPLL